MRVSHSPQNFGSRNGFGSAKDVIYVHFVLKAPQISTAFVNGCNVVSVCGVQQHASVDDVFHLVHVLQGKQYLAHVEPRLVRTEPRVGLQATCVYLFICQSYTFRIVIVGRLSPDPRIASCASN
jgi:hypothetical protein